MKVYIAEKPKVGKALAEFLGPVRKTNNFIEVKGGNVVTWLVGHLLENAEPAVYLPEDKRGYGDTSVLPIIPSRWKSEIKKETREQLNAVISLLKKATEIWNCGDIDREGQLVADEVIEFAGFDPAGRDKPVRRVMLVSLNDKDIAKAMSEHRSNGDPEFIQRRHAALSRQRADWLVGMNGSRSYSAAAGGAKVSIGRVQTPTLAMVVERDREIENFHPKDYFVVTVTMPDGRELAWKGRKGDDPGIDAEGRIISRQLAEEIAQRINAGMAGEVAKALRQDKTMEPPNPYNLSKLQTAVANRYGLSVAEVTRICQGLYENKLITYIGTDSEYLPESMHGEAKGVLGGISPLYGRLAAGADPAIKYPCWNDAKVSAHHAIIPTGVLPAGLSDIERQVFDTVARQYLAQFYPKYEYASNSLEVDFGEDRFAATWQEPIKMGWKAVLGGVEERDGVLREVDAENDDGQDVERTL